MAHVHSIPPIPGVDDLFSLLAFLSDKDACEKRLADMEHLRDEINRLVEAVGKVEQIDSLRIHAEGANAEAMALLAEAKKGMAAVREEIAKLRATAEEDERVFRAKLVQEREVWGAALREAEDAARQRDESVEARSKAAHELMNEAQRIAEEARALRDEYNGKLAKLKAAGVV